MQRIFIALIMVSFVVPSPALACMWDYDTIRMERERFPYAQELISGHFLRHSDSYYEWRISDRSRKSPYERTPADYDDLAVAYDKLGEHEKAIETIQEKRTRWPEEHLYETEANLGTFLIHAGRLEEGLPHIERAIAINPDAHFGREVYQKLLVEYVIEKRAAGVSLPLNEKFGTGPMGFAAFVLKQQKTDHKNQDAELRKATKGVLGMMRFGNYRSPILLEALGDLLVAVDWQEDSKMLAARSYLKASYEAPEESAQTHYRERAKEVLEMQVARNLQQVEAELKREIEQATVFYHQIETDENQWAASGKNLDQMYGQKYYTEPTLEVDHANYPPSLESRIITALIFLAVGVVAVGALSMWLLSKLFRKTNQALPQQDQVVQTED